MTCLRQEESLKLAILLIPHYLVSAIAAGLTFSCCKKKTQTQNQKTCVCAGGMGFAVFGNRGVFTNQSRVDLLRDNTGKTGQVVTFLSNNDVVVELAALLPELGAAIRSSKGSRQHQIKPVAALGTMFFHRHRRGSYLTPQPIRRVEQETLFHFVTTLS